MAWGWKISSGNPQEESARRSRHSPMTVRMSRCRAGSLGLQGPISHISRRLADPQPLCLLLAAASWRALEAYPFSTQVHLAALLIALTSNPHANDFLFAPWGPLSAYVCVTQEDGRLNVLWSTALFTGWIISSTLVIPPLYMVLDDHLQGYVISCIQRLIANQDSSCWFASHFPPVPLALTSAPWVLHLLTRVGATWAFAPSFAWCGTQIKDLGTMGREGGQVDGCPTESRQLGLAISH